MEPIRARIAEKIKQYRCSKGMSVDDVGKEIGKSGKTVSAWEVGRGQPDADTMIHLCRLFGIDISELYGEQSHVLTEQEQTLLSYMRSLDRDSRDQLVNFGLFLTTADGKRAMQKARDEYDQAISEEEK